MSLLTPTGIEKSYGLVQVLHEVNLSLAAGEVVRLVGDNGAGSARSRERAKADRPDAR